MENKEFKEYLTHQNIVVASLEDMKNKQRYFEENKTKIQQQKELYELSEKLKTDLYRIKQKYCLEFNIDTFIFENNIHITSSSSDTYISFYISDYNRNGGEYLVYFVEKTNIDTIEKYKKHEKYIDRSMQQIFNDIYYYKKIPKSKNKTLPQGAYQYYLTTEEWKTKRDLILKRDKYVCQGCLLAEATEVHHLTYDNAFDELAFQLISLCNECHKKVHYK